MANIESLKQHDFNEIIEETKDKIEEETDIDKLENIYKEFEERYRQEEKKFLANNKWKIISLKTIKWDFFKNKKVNQIRKEFEKNWLYIPVHPNEKLRENVEFSKENNIVIPNESSSDIYEVWMDNIEAKKEEISEMENKEKETKEELKRLRKLKPPIKLLKEGLKNNNIINLTDTTEEDLRKMKEIPEGMEISKSTFDKKITVNYTMKYWINNHKTIKREFPDKESKALKQEIIELLRKWNIHELKDNPYYSVSSWYIWETIDWTILSSFTMKNNWVPENTEIKLQISLSTKAEKECSLEEISNAKLKEAEDILKEESEGRIWRIETQLESNAIRSTVYQNVKVNQDTWKRNNTEEISQNLLYYLYKVVQYSPSDNQRIFDSIETGLKMIMKHEAKEGRSIKYEIKKSHNSYNITINHEDKIYTTIIPLSTSP